MRPLNSMGLGLQAQPRSSTQGGGVPGWQSGVDPFVEFDDENSVYSLNGVTYGSFDGWWAAVSGTFTRAGTKRYVDSDKVLKSAAAGVWPIEYDPADGSMRGRTVHPAVTARGVSRRDLTNAAWTKANGTAALDQTGIDAGANAASSFTATSANATCIQSVSDATSRNRCLPVFIKRVTGTGTVSLTLDGGTTWVDITSRLVSGQWADCTAAQAGVTNPGFGIRLSTSGDKIAWDFGRVVDGYYPGPALADGETNVADQPIIPTAGLSSFNNNRGTIAVRAIDTRDDLLAGGDCVGLLLDGNNCVIVGRGSNGAMSGSVIVANAFIGQATAAAGAITSLDARGLRNPSWVAMSYDVTGATLAGSGFAGSKTSSIASIPAALNIRLGYGRSGQSSMAISGFRMYREPSADRLAIVKASCTPKAFAVFGDSVGAGANGSQPWLIWNSRLAKALTPMRSRGNRAVGGSSSAQALAALTAATELREQTHLIWTTHNDVTTAAASVANLQAMSDLITHGRIVFATPLINPAIDTGSPSTRKQEIRTLIMSTFPGRYVDMQQAILDNGGISLFTPGEIHLNDAGQAVAFSTWLAFVQGKGW